MTHASDCGLHNAPAAVPTRCTCGASQAVRVWSYNIAFDLFDWVEHSRETLVAEVVCRSLVKCYNTQRKAVRSSLLIVRAFACGLVPVERQAIWDGWQDFWREEARDGFRPPEGDVVQHLDGSALTKAEGIALRMEPDLDECGAAVALYAPWWAQLPHPPDQL
jgi:hypothetical protein